MPRPLEVVKVGVSLRRVTSKMRREGSGAVVVVVIVVVVVVLVVLVVLVLVAVVVEGGGKGGWATEKGGLAAMEKISRGPAKSRSLTLLKLVGVGC